MIGPTEAERVQSGDRTGAHREDVAQDAAYARRRALVRLDEARMVVRLHLEDGGEAIPDVDDTRVLAGTLDDARPLRRKALQVNARGLVAAVLAPHHAEDAELRVGRRAPERLLDHAVFVGRELVLLDHVRGDRDVSGERAHAHGPIMPRCRAARVL
jgi:hypothetical protein